MIEAAAEPQVWPKRRWLATLTLVMAGQIGLIFWLNEAERAPHRASKNFTVFSSAQNSRGLAAIGDPTLPILPNRHGFSGAAWLHITPVERPSLEWTDPPQWLAPQFSSLGNAFTEFVRTNATISFDPIPPLEPILNVTENRPALDLLPNRTTLRVEGELAGRPLVSALPLISWPASNVILTDTGVRVGVAADGRVFSAVLLKSCGVKEADAINLKLAQSVRFQPLTGREIERSMFSVANLTWGTLVFDWHTVALPESNSGAPR